jgi:hypothetical protein
VNFGDDGRGLIDLLLEFLGQRLHVRFKEDAARVGGQLDDLQAVGGNSVLSFRLGRGRNMAKAFFSVASGEFSIQKKTVSKHHSTGWLIFALNYPSISQLKMVTRSLGEVLVGSMQAHRRADKHFALLWQCWSESNPQCKPLCVNFTAVFEVRTPK